MYRSYFNKWKSVSLRKKLISSFLLVSILPVLVISSFGAENLRQSIYSQKQESLALIMDVAITPIADSYDLFLRGELNMTEAKALAAERTGEIRYGEIKRDYFWIQETINNSPIMVMHPYRPDLDGTDLSNFSDPNGKKLFVEFMDVCNTKGSGYVDYYWQYYDETDRIVPKLSYVFLFDEWDWIIGSGIYIDDVDTIVLNQITLNLLISFFIIGAIVIFSIILSNDIVKPILDINNLTSKIADGDLTHTDSIKVMDLSDSFTVMVDNLKEIIHTHTIILPKIVQKTIKGGKSLVCGQRRGN